MHCPKYHLTMHSRHCLEYQDRARGKAKPKTNITSQAGCVSMWIQKYMPCLDCEIGRDVRNNGGRNDDVENLISVHSEQTKFCKRCSQHLPKSEFGPHAGNNDGLQPYCRRCQRKLQNEFTAKKRKEKEEMAKLQSIPTPISDSKGSIIAWSDQKFVCKKCNATYYADDWVSLNYVDDNTRMCGIDGCRGIVKLIQLDEAGPAKLNPIFNRTCTRCGYVGTDRDFHVAGNTGVINVCRKCVNKERIRKKAERANNTVVLGLNKIILDFSDYPDILDSLVADAKRNFRSLSNEIIFRLVSHD